MNPIVETYTGIGFNILNPKPEMVSLEDIAHGLSNCCRFAGQCDHFYSVAEHSVNVAQCVWNDKYSTPWQAQAALLHDASEAYIGDLTRTLKHFLPVYQEIEEKIQRAVLERFDISFTSNVVHKGIVKEYDNRVLVSEVNQLMTSRPGHWDFLDDVEEAYVSIHCFTPEEAKFLFLKEASMLGVK